MVTLGLQKDVFTESLGLEKIEQRCIKVSRPTSTVKNWKDPHLETAELKSKNVQCSMVVLLE